MLRHTVGMLHAILCYHSEQVVDAWTPEDDHAVMARLAAVCERLELAGKMGPVARLRSTASAKTLRKNQSPALLTDGPFAETKEQLLGFYVVDCADIDEATQIARDLADANPGGSFEIRPLRLFHPGAAGIG